MSNEIHQMIAGMAAGCFIIILIANIDWIARYGRRGYVEMISDQPIGIGLYNLFGIACGVYASIILIPLI